MNARKLKRNYRNPCGLESAILGIIATNTIIVVFSLLSVARKFSFLQEHEVQQLKNAVGKFLCKILISKI